MDNITDTISLWQPWATWVAAGWKTIETRLHPRFAPLVGKRIAIHASLKWDTDAFDLAWKWIRVRNLDIASLEPDEFTGGAIICTAIVKEHRLLTPADSSAALIECYTSRWGLILTDIVKLSRPIPTRGRQGIFKSALTLELNP